MREIYDFRILDANANLLFRSGEGKLLGGTVRKMMIDRRDSRFEKIGELNNQLRAETGKPFFYSWSCKRNYSKKELADANLFRLLIKASSVFEPEGEHCGTEYDDAAACPECGAGAPQISPLTLDFRRIPRNKDIAATIARSEWIVSEKLAALLANHIGAGLELAAVRRKAGYDLDSFSLRPVPTGRLLIREAERAGSGLYSSWMKGHEKLVEDTRREYISRGVNSEIAEKKSWPQWYQVMVKAPPVRISAQTRFGIGPFDGDLNGKYRCSRGHILGLNVLSEVSVAKQDWGNGDIRLTKQYVGVRQGVARPYQLILISSRLRSILLEHNVRGMDFEVAHLV